MKRPKLLVALACLALAAPLAHAAPQEPSAHQHEHGADAPQQAADADGMMARAQGARSPAERHQLMSENMAAMKAHMAEMKGMMDMGAMMDGKPMPMPMDAAQMEGMHHHMAMMHDMMERLMIQQDLMMKSSK